LLGLLIVLYDAMDTFLFICGKKYPQLYIHLSCILWLGITVIEMLKTLWHCNGFCNPSDGGNVQRNLSELVTKMARDMSYQKLSSLNQSYFENLRCLLIIVRSGPVLKFAWVRTIGETNKILATELDITDNQCCTSLSGRVG
jgi:hypothetical protein